ncbi:four helix bundle protein [Mariniflexile sp. HNIBRBA6329]|uniref:four helix bundle protein n=1 Tax=Mariniflexile sp. HNIBRBA6329 TaxID=3373088 RepID=UPI003746648C
MKENIIQVKTYVFALQIVEVYKYLCEDKKEFVLSKQLLRSGTSIGANIEEAIGGQSEKDFYAKLTISYKEARETKYWLRLLQDSGYLDEEKAIKVLIDVEEILRIIGSIQKTMKSKNSNP